MAITPLRVRGWLRALVRRNDVEQEMDEEMRVHLERATERLVARGLSPAAARAEARREFGNVAYIQEESRDARGVRWIEETAQDVRYAVRGLRLKPGFALAVIATLGLGVGANATMFGIVDQLLFRPPAYVIAADRTHRLYFTRMVGGSEYVGQSFQYQRFLDLSQSSRTMEVVAAYSPRRILVGAGENARELPMGGVSASLWRLFDAPPVIGRFFTADEDRDPTDGGARVVVLSYAFWQSEYAGSPSALGTKLAIGPASYTVIGVAPRGFAGVALTTPKAFVPIAVTAVDELGAEWTTDRTGYSKTWLELYGRRRPDASLDAATAELSIAFRDSYLKQIATDSRTAPIEIARPRMVLGSMLIDRGPRRSADARVATWLLGVASIVLLIACANVGNLLLARALGRRREIAVRIALGVSRARLFRQLLIESMVLAVLGALAGVLVAQWGGPLVRASLLPAVEWQSAITDGRTLLFASLSAVVVGLLAGVAPLLQASRSDVITALKAGARDGGGRRSSLRGALLLAQVTLSVMLLVGAGLFVRSVARIARVQLGYDAERLLLVEAHLGGVELAPARKEALRQALVESAMNNPIVESATLVCTAPFFGTCSGDVFVAGIDSANRLGEFVRQIASPTYFETTGTRILRGRAISPDDRAGGQLVSVVSEGMARALWPTQDAIGQCLRTRAATAPCRTVVGIAENERLAALGDVPSFAYYIPATQTEGERWGDPQKIRLFVRVRGEPVALGDVVRRDLQGVMPGSGYVVARPMTSLLVPVTRPWRLGATMFVVFGGLALALAAIGLYSVVAHTVAQRTHEIGVRIALGANVADVTALVVRDGLRVVIPGVAIGMGLALASGRWFGPLLFQVSPRDPLVFAAVAATLIGVALAASSVPAIRASRVDPATALRSD